MNWLESKSEEAHHPLFQGPLRVSLNSQWRRWLLNTGVSRSNVYGGRAKYVVCCGCPTCGCCLGSLKKKKPIASCTSGPFFEKFLLSGHTFCGVCLVMGFGVCHVGQAVGFLHGVRCLDPSRYYCRWTPRIRL